MFWRVSTYAQPTPVEALLDKGSPDLEELLQLDELLQVTGRSTAGDTLGGFALTAPSHPALNAKLGTQNAAACCVRIALRRIPTCP